MRQQSQSKCLASVGINQIKYIQIGNVSLAERAVDFSFFSFHVNLELCTLISPRILLFSLHVCVCVRACRLSDTKPQTAGVSTHVITNSPGWRAALTGVWTFGHEENSMRTAAGKTLILECKTKKKTISSPSTLSHQPHTTLTLESN